MISDKASLLSVLRTLEAPIMINIPKCPILAHRLCEFQSSNSVINQGKGALYRRFSHLFSGHPLSQLKLLLPEFTFETQVNATRWKFITFTTQYNKQSRLNQVKRCLFLSRYMIIIIHQPMRNFKLFSTLSIGIPGNRITLSRLNTLQLYVINQIQIISSCSYPSSVR